MPLEYKQLAHGLRIEIVPNSKLDLEDFEDRVDRGW